MPIAKNKKFWIKGIIQKNIGWNLISLQVKTEPNKFKQKRMLIII